MSGKSNAQAFMNLELQAKEEEQKRVNNQSDGSRVVINLDWKSWQITPLMKKFNNLTRTTRERTSWFPWQQKQIMI